MNKSNVNFEDSLFEASMRIIVQPLIDECDKYVSECENDDIKIPNKLKHRIHNVLLKERYSRIGKTVLSVSKRVVVAIMILSTLLMVACASIKPLRENIYNAIITWYDEYFSFAFSDKSEEINGLSEETFNYLPNGYVITSDISVGEYREVLIENGEKMITFLRRPYSKEDDYFDEHLIKVDEVVMENRTVVNLSDAEETTNIYTWVENGYWYMLNSDIDKSELIKIIEYLK